MLPLHSPTKASGHFGVARRSGSWTDRKSFTRTNFRPYVLVFRFQTPGGRPGQDSVRVGRSESLGVQGSTGPVTVSCRSLGTTIVLGSIVRVEETRPQERETDGKRPRDKKKVIPQSFLDEE